MQFTFLHQYIERLIDESGAFDSLSEDTRAEFIPQFIAEAERRIGLSVLPRLDEAGAQEFATLVQKEGVTPEELSAFWYAKVPDLDMLMQRTLEEFAAEFKQAVAEGV